MKDLLIKVENQNPTDAIVMIVDDHMSHIKSHIRYIYKPAMILHVFKHLYWHYKRKKAGIPVIEMRSNK